MERVGLRHPRLSQATPCYTANNINLPGVFLRLDLGQREACLESRHAYDAGD